MRFIGRLLFMISICSGVLFSFVSSVLTYPGATALTSTLYGAYSTAAVLVKAFIAALDEAYIDLPAFVTPLHIELMFTIRPYALSFIFGMSRFVNLTAAQKFTSIMFAASLKSR